MEKWKLNGQTTTVLLLIVVIFNNDNSCYPQLSLFVQHLQNNDKFAINRCYFIFNNGALITGFIWSRQRSFTIGKMLIIDSIFLTDLDLSIMVNYQWMSRWIYWQILSISTAHRRFVAWVSLFVTLECSCLWCILLRG